MAVPVVKPRRSPSADRIVLWPAFLALGLPGAFVLLCATPIGASIVYVIVLLPAFALVASLAVLIATVAALWSASRRAWRRALAYAVLPLALLAAAPAGFGGVAWLRGCGFMLRFEIERSRLLDQVRAMPDDGRPKFALWEWDGFGSISLGVVYDESDEVAVPQAKRSDAWKQRNLNAPSVLGVTPMGGHFYLATFG